MDDFHPVHPPAKTRAITKAGGNRTGAQSDDNANMLASGMKRMDIAAVYNPRSKYHVFWTLVLAN
jgi:hypothetical protein